LCDYLENINKLGTHADYIVIQHFSKMMDDQMIKIIDFDSEEIVIGSDTTKLIIYLGYDSKLEHYISIEPLRSNPTSLDRRTFDTDVKIGQYYAVDYVDRFYIGRVLNKGNKTDHFEIKFLHQMSQFGQIISFGQKKMI